MRIGQKLAAGDRDSCVHILDVGSGTILLLFRVGLRSGPLMTIAYRPYGQSILVAGAPTCTTLISSSPCRQFKCVTYACRQSKCFHVWLMLPLAIELQLRALGSYTAEDPIVSSSLQRFLLAPSASILKGRCLVLLHHVASSLSLAVWMDACASLRHALEK